MGATTRERLLTATEAADILGLKTQTLAVWRCEKRSTLPFIKVGRAVRYRAADIEAYIESQREVHEPINDS